MNIIWPQQIAYLFPGTPLNNGWLACIVGAGTLSGQICGPFAIKLIPRTRYILISATLTLIAFSGAMLDINVGDRTKGIAFMFFACFTVGVTETCVLSLAPLTCPSEDIGAALGALGSIRNGGASIASAIYTTILSNKLTKFIPEYVATAVESHGLPASSVSTLLGDLTTGNFTNLPGLNSTILAAAELAEANAAADSFK
jgi:hypothetical protein